MVARISNKTKQFILSIELPDKTKSYTPISHGFAVNEITQNLLSKSFIIKDERYRSTANGKIANGVFELNRTDEDMQMICCFTNSYDKSTRFSVAIGAKVVETGNYFISDLTWIRKHSGTADDEAKKEINNQISQADNYFNKLKAIKDKMIMIKCTNKQFGSIIGQLYVNNLISTEQISECLTKWRRMEIDDEVDSTNLWKAFNFILCTMQKTHPGKWMQNSILVTMYVMDMFNIKIYSIGEQSEMDFNETDGMTTFEQTPFEEVVKPFGNENNPIDEDPQPEEDDNGETESVDDEIQDTGMIWEGNEQTEEVESNDDIEPIEKPVEDEPECEPTDVDDIIINEHEKFEGEEEEREIEEEKKKEAININEIDDGIVRSFDDDDFVPFMVLDETILDSLKKFLVSNNINDSFIAYDEGTYYKVITSNNTMEIEKGLI